MNSPEKILLKLYVVKKSPDTSDMVQRLKYLLDSRICQEYILEVIDILANPETAIQDKILASPTLIKTQPFPQKRIVGKLLYGGLFEELEID